MHPFGFDGIEPGTLFRQKQREDAHAFARSLDLLVMLTNPGAHKLAVMPGGIIPDEQPRHFALVLQLGAAPVQKLRRDVTHGTPIDKAQGHPVPNGSIGWPSLPEYPVAGL